MGAVQNEKEEIGKEEANPNEGKEVIEELKDTTLGELVEALEQAIYLWWRIENCV